MEFTGIRNRLLARISRVESVRDAIGLILLLASPLIFWVYCYKFMGMSAEYLEAMSRDIMIAGTQMNTSYYPMERLALVVGGFVLACFLLVQNDFRSFAKEPTNWRGYSASVFGIIAFALCYVLVTMVLEFSPSSQVPFFFLGGAVVAGFLLLQDNISEILLIRPSNFSEYTSLNPRSVSAWTSILVIVLFGALTLNISFVPAISSDIPAFLSAVMLVTVFGWAWVISQERMKPSIQAHRSAALAYLALLPIIMYFLLRVLYLQHDPDPVMQNRWEVKFDFMDKVNTFKINPWPMDVEPNYDPRWLFLKAAIINSARATLVSIFLCTILGTIIGVTRLSSNKLASTVATAYVEVFRNLPLAVLLFLISTQIGLQFPHFSEEAGFFGGAIYYSNQGIFFVTVNSNFRLLVGIVALALLRAYLHHLDRIEPRTISTPSTALGVVRRPFHSLGWRVEPLAAELFVVASAVVFLALFLPFVSTHGGGRDAAIGAALLVYALYVNTNVDDDGMNAQQIDDSESGVRKRFTIWVSALALAAGVAVSGGLSWPEYVKPSLTSPGSWTMAEGTGFEITPFFLAMIMGLTLFTASTVAEIVRGSIQALPRGQVEAAISLGLNPYQRLRLVILPQALRSMVPLMNNQFMNVWKNSSLAVIVAYTDIFYVILVMMNNVGKLIPLFILLLITYQAGSLAISAVMNWYNARVTSVKI